MYLYVMSMHPLLSTVTSIARLCISASVTFTPVASFYEEPQGTFFVYYLQDASFSTLCVYYKDYPETVYSLLSLLFVTDHSWLCIFPITFMAYM
jgi:hypothetical protein